VLENQGIAIGGRARLHLPADVIVVDSGAALAESARVLTWPFTLGDSQRVELTTWVRLPDAEDTLAFEAQVQTGEPPDFSDLLSLRLNLAPTRPPGLDAARLAMEADTVFRKPLRYLTKAADRLAKGDADRALASLLTSARALARITTPEAAQIRHWVDNAIAETAAAIADGTNEESDR
jgi:hypothetical protein